MTLQQAEQAYADAKAQDNGTSIAARKIMFAARALTDAAEEQIIDRLTAKQMWSDDMTIRFKDAV